MDSEAGRPYRMEKQQLFGRRDQQLVRGAELDKKPRELDRQIASIPTRLKSGEWLRVPATLHSALRTLSHPSIG